MTGVRSELESQDFCTTVDVEGLQTECQLVGFGFDAIFILLLDAEGRASNRFHDPFNFLWQNLHHFAQRRRDWPEVGFEIAQWARQCTFAVADGALGAAVLLMGGLPL